MNKSKGIDVPKNLKNTEVTLNLSFDELLQYTKPTPQELLGNNESMKSRPESTRNTITKRICPFCLESLEITIFFKHLRTEHEEFFPFKCNDCGFMSEQKHQLNQHVSKKHKLHNVNAIQPRVECRICSKYFKTLKILKTHLDVHRSKRFKCGYCKFTSILQIQVRYHLNLQHKEDTPLIVPVVIPQTVTENQINQMQLEIVNQLSRKPKDPDKKIIKLYNCSHCDYSSRFGTALLRHRRKHSLPLDQCLFSDDKMDADQRNHHQDNDVNKNENTTTRKEYLSIVETNQSNISNVTKSNVMDIGVEELQVPDPNIMEVEVIGSKSAVEIMESVLEPEVLEPSTMELGIESEVKVTESVTDSSVLDTKVSESFSEENNEVLLGEMSENSLLEGNTSKDKNQSPVSHSWKGIDIGKYIKNKSIDCILCICGKKTVPKAFYKHVHSHMNIKPYKCGYCLYRSIERSKVKVHHMFRHSQLPFKVDVKVEQSVRVADRSLVSKKKFTCPLCDKTMNSHVTTLQRHFFNHFNYFPYKCGMCQFQGVSKAEVKQHFVTHNNSCEVIPTNNILPKPLEDLLLNMRKESKSNCDKMVTDEGEEWKNILLLGFCPWCISQFKHTATNAFNHFKTHFNFNNYKCGHCYRYFHNKASVVQHSKRKHPGRVYDIQIPKLRQTLIDGLKSHSSNHTFTEFDNTVFASELLDDLQKLLTSFPSSFCDIKQVGRCFKCNFFCDSICALRLHYADQHYVPANELNNK